MRQINFANAMVVNEIDGIPHLLLLKDRHYRWVAPNVMVEEGTESEAKSFLEYVLEGMEIEQLPSLEVKEECHYHLKKSREDILLTFLAYALKTKTDTLNTQLELDREKYLEARWFPYNRALHMISNPYPKRIFSQKQAFKTIYEIADITNVGFS